MFWGFFLLVALAGSAHADDRAFLHYLGGSVYVDDKDFLDLTGESGYAYKGFGDFFGGFAYTGDKTFLDSVSGSLASLTFLQNFLDDVYL